MQESTTYQAILKKGFEQGLEEARKERREQSREEGYVDGAQRCLIRRGTRQFGKPDSAVLAAIEAIKDFKRIAAMAELLLEAEVRDWYSLLAAP
jgi:hypothetical protein